MTIRFTLVYWEIFLSFLNTMLFDTILREQTGNSLFTPYGVKLQGIPET